MVGPVDDTIQGGFGQHVDQEVAAELTACALMHLHGPGDRTGNSWRYLQSYSEDPLHAIANALDTLQKVLAALGV